MAFQFSQTGQELQYLFNEVVQLAGDYDGTVTYAVGDYCNYLGTVYRCTASTTGTFDAADWTTVIVLDELESLTTRVTTAETNITSVTSSVTSSQGGCVQRTAVAVSNGSSTTITFSSDYSSYTEFALVCLNLSGNALSGMEILVLGRGTSKIKVLIGSMSTSYYSASYSGGDWTITNNSGSTMYVTAMITKA